MFNKPSQPISIESIVTNIANAILYIGIACSGILIIKAISSGGFGILELITPIATLAVTSITWGILRIMCNISNCLIEIRAKMK